MNIYEDDFEINDKNLVDGVPPMIQMIDRDGEILELELNDDLVIIKSLSIKVPTKHNNIETAYVTPATSPCFPIMEVVKQLIRLKEEGQRQYGNEAKD